jgi:diguanylate cyclase (GGDEF)-like protein
VGNFLHTVRSKVVAVTLLVVLGTQIATVTTVLIVASRDVDDRAEEYVKSGSKIFTKVVSNRASLLRKIVQPLSVDVDFGNTLATGDSSIIAAELNDRAKLINADIAMVLDAKGNMIASSNGLTQTDEILTDLIETDHTNILFGNTYYEMISVELNQSGNAGWVSMGFTIDDGLAQQLASITGLEMTLIASSVKGDIRLLGSSLSRKNRESITNITLEVANGLDPLVAVERLRDEYYSMRVPYIKDSRTVFALIQMPTEEALAPYRRQMGALLHAAGTALLGALIMAIYLSRIATRPIPELLQAARRMQVGNYTKQLNINSGDEFGELANAFDAMQEGISEREQTILYQAQFDSLTGLPNRTQSIELLRSYLRISNKTGNPVAIMVMHLQRFREIQSSLGHEIGEEVLCKIAQRLRSALDEAMELARLEGDQFLIIAPNTDQQSSLKIAHELEALLDTDLSVQSVNLTLDACIGICVSPDHGKQPDKLIRRALVAKNDAQHSLSRIHVYQNGREARHVRQLAILGDLRRAADENELKLFLQPKVSLQSSQVCGAEALLRWVHPELGNISPVEFIPLAENAGSISMITEWVMRRVIKLCVDWQRQGTNLQIAVNLSSRDLVNNRLITFIQTELEKHKVSPTSIILEITEESFVHDIERTTAVLEKLRGMGFSISMDDFGTGYSSLGHLRALPVDELKIDRSFITNLPDQQQNTAIVRSIIELAHNLKLEVVAEGVESSAALRWLREEGCERAQGYYFSKPLPAENFVAWLRNWNSLADETDENTDYTDSLILRPRLIT